jgi:hypothetical protein
MGHRRIDTQRKEAFANEQANGKCIVKDDQYKSVNLILHYAYHFSPSRSTNRSHYFGLKHLDAGVPDQAVETQLEEPEGESNQSAFTSLLVCASVADSVEDP